MYQSCINKQNQVKTLFAACCTDEERYKKIIEIGRSQPRLPPEQKVPANLVAGCQSTVYLMTTLKDGCIYFAAEADALISAGLAEILVQAYSGETAEAILKCPPSYLDDLGMRNSLSPNRANGLYSIHLRMKQEALKTLLPKKELG